MSYEEGCLMSMKFLQIKVYIFTKTKKRGGFSGDFVNN